jgi:polyhydroxyalkanoate synthesis regulator phasin
MRLSRALNDKKLDLRLRDKLVHEGKMTHKEVEDYLNSLPDDAANATTTGKVEEREMPAE